ncbi:FkbM family methyltransferase [Corallococcus sp. CA047B]|uniref:FkbM family methyltransferase n=1 Tax=Corallococcus sp. CA047B TaxID=2316729 RepID=UPI000EA2CB7B|nr:FkbM family methyltransferase [Corallococcus sp. CA047B]RKH13166.1 FkbM family methyltransferase [Corallococcus sp. CA047B]
MNDTGLYHEHSRDLIRLWNKAVVSIWGKEGQAEWYEYSMRRMLVYGALLRQCQVQPEGILYIGAHSGSLLWVWLLLGFRNVLMVEPQPDVFQGLERNARVSSALSLAYDEFLGSPTPTQIQVAQCAIDDHDGEEDLFVLSSSGLSSLQKPMEAALDQWKAEEQVSGVDRLKVPVRTLDSLLQEMTDAGGSGRYNVLYMNIQGAELKALRGASRTLRTLDFIYLEKNFEVRYEGTPESEELDAFLREHGFEAHWGMKQTSLGNGYTAYARKPR